MVLVSFWRYPDPYRLKRIRIRPNYTEPYGSGSETLVHIEEHGDRSLLTSLVLIDKRGSY